MTLNDIIVSALMQLDRGHDAQTLDIWRDKLTAFANDAVADLARRVKPTVTETAAVKNGFVDLTALSKTCVRLVRVTKSGRELKTYRSDSGKIRLGIADGEVEVTYVYLPRALSAPTDEPDLPEICHGLIVTYVVGRERASGDASVQRGANIYFQLYEAGKAALLPHFCTDEDFKILNRWQ